MSEQTGGNAVTPQQQQGQADATQQVATQPQVAAQPEVNQYEAILKGLDVEPDKLPGIIQEYRQLKTQNPYPNDLVKKLAEGFQQGKSLSDMQGFLQVQLMDTANMSDEAAIKARLKMDNPYFSEEDIQFEFDDMFGDQEDDRRASKIRREAAKAKEWLNSQKASADIPGLQDNSQAEQRRALLTQSWAPIVNQISASSREIAYSYEGKEIDGKYDFVFKVPDAPLVERQVNEAVLNYAASQGLELTQDNLGKLAKYREQMLWNIHRDDILKHMVIDIIASTKEAFTKQRTKVKVPTAQAPPAQRQPAKTKAGPRPGFV